MKSLQDLEARVLSSERLEIVEATFTLGKGTAASTERWYLINDKGEYYGDSIEEVVEKSQKGPA